MAGGEGPATVDRGCGGVRSEAPEAVTGRPRSLETSILVGGVTLGKCWDRVVGFEKKAIFLW